MSFTLLNTDSNFQEKLRTAISNSNVNSKLYLVVGFSLLLLYIVQLTLQLKFHFLVELQHDTLYKQTTGYLLLLYVGYQFKLARARKDTKSMRYHFSLHKIQGVFAPLVLYIHSMELGYAYQVLLSSLFLTNCLLGLLSPQQFKLRNVSYVNCWLILHVSVALLIVALALYHLFVTYWYS
ncbi:MAG: hypothetical protein ACC657_18195 [Thiohalomonadales bacterium]